MIYIFEYIECLISIHLIRRSSGNWRRINLFLAGILFTLMVVGMLPTSVSAHRCGEDSLEIDLGGSGSYTIESPNDRTTSYEVIGHTNPFVADIIPDDPFYDTDATWSIVGIAPGTTTVTIAWDAREDGGESGTCEFVVAVEPLWDIRTGANHLSTGKDGDPVSTFTGELFFAEAPDLALGGPLPLTFRRYYASFLNRDGRIDSQFGPNWTHNFDWRLIAVDTSTVEVVTWRGRVLRFMKQSGSWTQSNLSERPYQLAEESGGFRLANPRTQRIYVFDTAGRLTSIADGRGNQLTLTYNAGDQLSEVSDGLGRVLTFEHTSAQLVSVSDGTRTVTFEYAGGLLSSVTDPLGNTTSYSYESGHEFIGLLTTRTLPNGNARYTQTYNAAGRVATQTDALGNTTTFEYTIDEETGERTTTVTDPLGNITRHVHDFRGQLLTVTDATGQTIELGYSDAGQRNRITDRLGDVTRYTFDAASRLPITVTDARGGVTAYSYTGRSDEGFVFQELTAVERADGSSVSYSYDTNGNPTTLTDPAGGTRTATYNNRGQPLTITNPEGGTTTMTYNDDGTLASVEDPAGNTTTYVYDNLHRPITITRPDGTTLTISYDAADRISEVTDEAGRTYVMSYDDNGNRTGITDPAGETIQMSYDAMDRLVSVTDRKGNTISFLYDADGRLVERTDRTGKSMTLIYDALDHLSAVTNAAGETWLIDYNAEGIPTSITNPAGETTTLTSNSMGWITQITSPLDHTTNPTFDALGRIMSVQDPAGHTTQFSRDSRGFLTDMTLPGGTSASYTRDGLGLLEGRTGPSGGSWQILRDDMGRVSERNDPLGRSATYSYDSRNRIASVEEPDGHGTLTPSYDATGRLTALAHSGGPNLSYTYDANGRLTGANGVTLTRDAEGRITESNGLSVTRDPEGRITSVTLPGGMIRYRYDAAGRVSEVEDWQGGITGFNYDPAGRLRSISRPNGIQTAYTYNADGRLVGMHEIAGDGDTLAASLLTRDARGNVTAAARTGVIAPDAMPPDAEWSYDTAGQIEAFDHDAKGRRTADSLRTYTWDGLSRLTSFSDGSGTINYTYDAFGNRLTKETGETAHTYVWNYALSLSSVAVEKAGGTDRRYYVHAPSGLLLYSVNAMNGSRRYYHYDEMGNTVMLTGGDGAAEAAYAYSPYGQVVADSGGVENPFTWQGQYGVMAEGDGLYYMRARYYDARSRRFLTRDRVQSLRPDEINPYQYARNNPGRYIDPTGMQAQTVEDIVFNFRTDRLEGSGPDNVITSENVTLDGDVRRDQFDNSEHTISDQLTTTGGAGHSATNGQTLDFNNNDLVLTPHLSGDQDMVEPVSGGTYWGSDDLDVSVEPVIFDAGPTAGSVVRVVPGQKDNFTPPSSNFVIRYLEGKSGDPNESAGHGMDSFRAGSIPIIHDPGVTILEVIMHKSLIRTVVMWNQWLGAPAPRHSPELFPVAPESRREASREKKPEIMSDMELGLVIS